MKDKILKELRLKLWNVYATIFQSSGYDNKQLKEKEDIIVKFFDKAIDQTREETISEERKRIYCYIEEMLIGSDNELLKNLSNIIFDKTN